MAVALHKSYALGDFELDTDKYLLKHHNSSVHLPELPFQVLLYLVEHRERYVSRQELLEKFWQGSDAYEETLTKCISTIRAQLNDPPNAPRFIETRKKVGYRYIGPFQDVVSAGALVEPSVVEIERTRGVAISIDEADHDARAPEVVIPAQLISGKQRPLWKRPPVRAAAGLVVGLLIIGGFLSQSRWSSRTKTNASSSIRSIAVLPLENMSGDPAQDYFADGITEELITEMAKIGSLRVISRTSVVQYKGTHKRLPEIARELNVDGIVEGAVIRSGGRVRITAQLINAATDQHIWAESFERDLTDVLSLQSEVARGIANQINIKLTQQEQTLLAGKAPVNPAASEAYLKGLYLLNQSGMEPQVERKKPLQLKSIEAFQGAVNLQPDYALAYAGLAAANYSLAFSQGMPEFLPKAKEAAIKALQLDENLAEAHAAVAVMLFNEWDWPDAEREFKRALDLNPSYARAHAGYSMYLSAAGRHAEAIAEVRQAEALDPLKIGPKAGVGQIYNQAHEYDKAIEQYRKVLDLSPNDEQSHGALGLAYSRKGMYAEALAEMKQSVDLSHGNPFPETGLALIYAETGKRAEAKEWLKKVIAAYGPDPTLAVIIALVDSVLDEKDEAFKWLDRAYQAHAQNLLLIRSYPEFDGLHSDARYAELLRRIGFPS
jgi:TolB-like protein/DNA-binding winged helix-turn-helix (wHTH) protein/Flp pilus assembly protein TadD